MKVFLNLRKFGTWIQMLLLNKIYDLNDNNIKRFKIKIEA